MSRACRQGSVSAVSSSANMVSVLGFASMTCLRSMSLLAVSDWSFGVGDPTVLGWTVCVSYFVVAALCWRRAQRCAGVALVRSRRFWIALAVVLVLLGFNKQLDLQKLITQVARSYAKQEGWYRERKSFQTAAAGVALFALAAFVAWSAFLLRRDPRTTWFAMVGLALIAAYIVVRAVSLHSLESILYVGPVRFRDWTEPIGIALIAFAAWDWRGSRRNSGRSRDGGRHMR